jgi:hypothetical protein
MVNMYKEEISKISSYMIKDHFRILSLLHSFEMNSDNKFQIKIESFKTFKWHLEKHVFVEERAIFLSDKYDKSTEDFSLLFEISKQHNEIMNEVTNIYQNLKINSGFEIEKLRDLLNKHLNFEEKIAYQKLDEIITDKEKNRIINSIRDIISDI